MLIGEAIRYCVVPPFKTVLKTVDRTFSYKSIHFYYKHVRTKLVIVQTCHNMFGFPISSTGKKCILYFSKIFHLMKYHVLANASAVENHFDVLCTHFSA